LSPSLEVKARALDVLTASGHWSRSGLRSARGGVRFSEGPPVPFDTRLSFGSDWKPVRFQSRRFEVRASFPPLVLVDKPLGMVTSRVPEAGAPTIFELLDPALRARVEPVGRLDKDTEGLLLLTGDGGLIQWLSHPRRAIPRRYTAQVVGTPDPEILEQIRQGGFALKDGHVPSPVVLEADAEEGWKVVLTSGKYHEVRRIFGAAGARVTALRRDGYAGFERTDLDGAPVHRLSDEELVHAYLRLGFRLPDPILETRDVDHPHDRQPLNAAG
jgi:16S rRNA pseudouridine516 synthase